MGVTKTHVAIRSYGDIINARQTGRELAQELGFGLADQTRLATAISELTSNVLHYAGLGVCTIADQSNQAENCIQVIVEDNGPGIPDIELAMRQGFSTGGTLGAGLPGTKRLVHEFQIESRPGFTKVVIAMMAPKMGRVDNLVR
ncbi:MAG TPA: anti-sigma regulatory factor [Chloroflexi bacterium]|nr:anti-sigma regulatory factor [Chloroflexota bacterium]